MAIIKQTVDKHRIGPKYILIILIKVYRYAISPLFGSCCRFYPSCSQYALEAITLHGALRGGWLTTKRLLRCQPWHQGGIDCVPASSNKSALTELNQ